MHTGNPNSFSTFLYSVMEAFCCMSRSLNNDCTYHKTIKTTAQSLKLFNYDGNPVCTGNPNLSVSILPSIGHIGLKSLCSAQAYQLSQIRESEDTLLHDQFLHHNL